ncbi:peptidyl-prolyl cis-trans isomerase [Salipaludibacillus daqingensis]|uniref:peptidyl-prolyl cis-trans isomerase n=1 Tax=Salipaludibacillus daqingensis TaxID=3041001 RepID=UPI0024756A47|nr:peptidyl-prolyl cis-trans isomerase [Salipaludibacillus daqingensis]
MSSMIISIKGLVKHTITLDPGAWLFDERIVDLNTYFLEEKEKGYDPTLEQMGRAWDNQRQVKAKVQKNDNEIKVSKKDLTEKSLGISFEPFLTNATPLPEAKTVRFIRSGEEDFECSLEEANKAIIGFSYKGKALKDTGPIHFYYADGSNQHHPITHIHSIIVS